MCTTVKLGVFDHFYKSYRTSSCGKNGQNEVKWGRQNKNIFTEMCVRVRYQPCRPSMASAALCAAAGEPAAPAPARFARFLPPLAAAFYLWGLQKIRRIFRGFVFLVKETIHNTNLCFRCTCIAIRRFISTPGHFCSMHAYYGGVVLQRTSVQLEVL